MNDQFYIEKTKEDGTKLEIRVRIQDKKFILENIGVKPKGKRKYTYVCSSSMTNDYSYRRLSMEDRRKHELNKMLEVCPIELINDAIEEAWLSIKPNKFTL